MRMRHSSGDTVMFWQLRHFAIEGAAWLAVAVGVCHKEQPRARMIEADTASRENTRPDGVAQLFQVIANAIEPIPGKGNLFTKDRARTTFSDEPKPSRPKMLFSVLPPISPVRRA